MIPLSTETVAAVAGGHANGHAVCTGVAVDSRRVVPGDLFVALRGERTDGARYVDAALAAGAAAALVRAPDERPGTVAVADPLAGLQAVAAAVRARGRARVVGITGSTGKTSTKDILAALLAPHLAVVASRANENNELGVPLTLCRIEPGTDACVAELAMRGAGQIAELAAIARPDVAVITGIGPVHLELLGTVEAVARAKAEILAALPPGGTAVVPDGEPLLAPYVGRDDVSVVTFGPEPSADVQAVGLRRDGRGGGRAELRLRGRTLVLPVNFTQAHNALNLAAAVAACAALGLPADALDRGSAAVRFSKWRGEELPFPGGGVLIADCYNANPVSMAAALRHLAEVADGRRTVAVLGDMAELGPGAEGFHREVGEAARAAGILVVGVGPLARHYGGEWHRHLAGALAALPAILHPGDAVLVKGSRSMGLEAVVEALAP